MDDMHGKPNKSAGGFRPSDLQDLPDPEARLLRFIMRESGISHQRLRQQVIEAPELDMINPQHLDQHLAELLERGNIRREEINGVVHYRPQIRRTPKKSMTGIWAALDADESGQSPETVINPELRKTRSALADSILADLSIEAEFNYNAPPDETIRNSAESLMSDLAATGRSSMAKRSAPPPPPKKQDDLMGDLVRTGKRATSMQKSVEVQQNEGLLARLLRALGIRS